METIDITSDEGKRIRIKLASTTEQDRIKVIDEAQALDQGEAIYQLYEGGSYEFEIDKGYFLEEISGIITSSKLNKQTGRITPNIYVGSLPINILESSTHLKVGELRLEIQSFKTSYREDYRRMLEDIAEKCTDLLMQHKSPVVQTFTVDLEKESETAYQRFAFIKSVINSEEFESAINKILSAPTTKWQQTLVDKPIQAVRKMNRKMIRQFTSSANRVQTPVNHPLQEILSSLPEKVQMASKEETVDTPENRFIKFALESFLRLCGDFGHLDNGVRIKAEASLLEEKVERHLSHAVFSEISTLSTIPLNNPVLQRKEGYREIYRTWILIDLAAKLIWKGGEDVYEGNKRDVAVLYEYWLFFKLLETVSLVFDLKPPDPENLLEETADGFGLKLRQGEYLPIKGISDTGSRKLNVQLSYNRTYKGDQAYPKSGSWSRSLRPDYTLTIWPFGIEEDQAEDEELIVHIHFDAKYKVEKFQEIFSDYIQLDIEKDEQRKGTYKRADLLKMHAYKDAIRRTAGAYVLYPGDDQPRTKKGFHEIVPGLGAFAIRPSKRDSSGTEELESFLNAVVSHFMNRASQREKIALKTYQTYKLNKPNELREALPETYGHNRNLIPDETFVLVGYASTKVRFNWYEANSKYIFRMDESKGSLELSFEVVNSKYLLLRKGGEIESSDLFSIKSKGPKVFSKEQLIKLKYPLSKTPKDYYLEIDIERVTEEEYQNVKWKFKELGKYKSVIESETNPYSKAGLPFTITLTELMQVAAKEY